MGEQESSHQYGNYHDYYSSRSHYIQRRFSLLSSEYFLNKRVLDIGCNDGTFLILVAIRYFPALCSGIDLDYQLVNQAVDNQASQAASFSPFSTFIQAA